MDDKNIRIKNSLIETFEKRKNQVCRSYIVKIQNNKLNLKQKEALTMMFVEAKWFYNYCINWSKQDGNSIFKLNSTSIKNVKHFNKDKEEIESTLNYLGSSMKASIVKNMCSNIKTMNTLIKKGFQTHNSGLKFKKDFTSIHLKQYGITHKIVDKNHIKIQGIKKPLYVNGLNQINLDYEEVATMNLLNKPNGFYISIVTYTDKNKISNKKEEKLNPIAIDFGCETSFTTSEGNKINVSIKETEHLKKLQRQMSRQKKGSNNRYKTHNLIKKEYQKLTNRKDDLANKIVSKLKHNYKTIIIQDEQLQNWHKNRHGKAVQYSVLGRVKSKLKLLDQTIILDKFIPTTKFCFNCGKIKKEMPQYIRQYKCSCGVDMDRDIHAAKNMLWIYEIIKALNLLPVERRDIKRVEFLTAVKTIFNYSGDKLLKIQEILEDTFEDLKIDDTYLRHLFETMNHEDTTSLA